MKEVFIVHAVFIIIIIYTGFIFLLGYFHVFICPNYVRVELPAAACADLPRGWF